MTYFFTALTLCLYLLFTACGSNDTSPAAPITPTDSTNQPTTSDDPVAEPTTPATDDTTPPPAATTPTDDATPPVDDTISSNDSNDNNDDLLVEVVSNLLGPRAILFGPPDSDLADELFVVNFIGAEAAWVRDFGSDAQRVLGIQNSLVGAIAVALDQNGLFYFACLTPVMGNNFGVVTVRDFNSQVSDFQYTGVSGPTGLALDSQGRLFVANQRNGTIARIDFADGGSPDAHGVQTLADGINFGSNSLPNHLFLDANENLYISETAANRIQVLSGNNLGIFASQGLNQPVSIAQRANGNFLVSNHGNGTIVELDAEGEALQTIDTELGAEVLYGITVRGNGEVYIVADDRGDGSVYRVDLP